jgi:adenine C2-methylase RlmN of 23S rRNA A2503 and tRNA A37
MADATTKVKRRRDPLSPKPILDRKTLVKALKERGLSIKDSHLDTFYQLLHRQHYPDLKTFVDNYNLREIATSNNNSNNSDKENGNRANSKVVTAPPQKLKSTKNAVSSTKGNVRRLPKVFLEFLADPNNDFVTLTSTIAHRPTSKDGSTTKMAIKLQDGHMVESVLMRHVSAGGSRATLCVSSQVGCAMGCTFCATGTMGIRGNLCTGEILEQLVHADKVLMEELCAVEAEAETETETETEGRSKQNQKTDQNLAFVRNIVYMGMGEPLNNYDNVIEACRGMIDRKRWNLAHGRVTVSTVGVTPKMRKLTQEIPEINLALSLHAPNQPMREAIVPTAKIYPIQDMVDALDEHMMALVKAKSEDGTFNLEERKSASKRKRAMIEYVMCKFSNGPM